MYENYLLVVGIILLLWLGAMGVYLVSSHQQRGLQAEIEKLEQKLTQVEQEEAA